METVNLHVEISRYSAAYMKFDGLEKYTLKCWYVYSFFVWCAFLDL